MPRRPWRVVRVTHITWEQHGIGRYRRRWAATIVATINTISATLARDRSYEVWRDA